LIKFQTSLKFKFKLILNHMTGLNGFKPGHCSPGPPVGAFPLPYFLPMQRENVHHPTPPRLGRCRRPTLGLRASRARPPPHPPSLVPLKSDWIPPPCFGTAVVEHSPTLPSLVHARPATQETIKLSPYVHFSPIVRPRSSARRHFVRF
jgi:hypothetical protein